MRGASNNTKKKPRQCAEKGSEACEKMNVDTECAAAAYHRNIVSVGASHRRWPYLSGNRIPKIGEKIGSKREECNRDGGARAGRYSKHKRIDYQVSWCLKVIPIFPLRNGPACRSQVSSECRTWSAVQKPMPNKSQTFQTRSILIGKIWGQKKSNN